MKLVHIGYYNEVEDLKHLADRSADFIVLAMKNNIGHFFKVDYETYDGEELSHLNPQFTNDGEYAVVNDLPIDLNLIGAKNVCDFFIDIYKVVN